MPTIKRISNSLRFFFFSFDCNEAVHVHVRKENKVCKFWLNPVVLAKNHGFSPKELNTIRKTINKNIKIIEKAWYEHCY